GIYDSVSLLLGDNPIIETVQVAPRIKSSEIIVETKLRNYGAARAAELRHTLKAWKGGQQAASGAPERIELKAGEERTVRQTIRIPNARLWSPEEPFLYVLESSTGGDSASSRFGMREFRFDTATRRAWLNGKVYFLRGSNVTLHRFFEDPGCKRLPWTEAWVRKLLAEIPKKMNWNSFRFCIGPVPDRWLEIADEAGLLIQNEYFIWTGHPEWRGVYSRKWNGDFLVEEYKRWMRDNWNHPSVAIWDANNESFDPIFADKVIPAVRGLDLSGRPWENSYNIPVGPDDPVEHHPYLFSRTENDSDRPFRMAELEEMGGAPRGAGNIPSGHAAVVNEYGWIWLNRDGTPTELTKKVYADLTGPNATAEERFAMNGYLLGGLTEYWRAFRHYAGVLHFVYLTCSYPGVYTSDHFRNLETLELDPYFADYVGEAFKPLGIYIHFWQPELKAGAERTFPVMMVNDGARPVKGRLVLSLEAEGGGEAARAETAFELMANGQETYLVKLRVPAVSGSHLLKASAVPGSGGPTVSRRKVTVQ
ncbi:MAG TPA: glycoside hydrolase family 2 TIM barrel-domain containing protein, partial [Bryobacteraceae bacterium]|nr:glycoside hydrolase family 2 TIM barrel-domain containing protein [Bryobacteraceae bacterium]